MHQPTPSFSPVRSWGKVSRAYAYPVLDLVKPSFVQLRKKKRITYMLGLGLVHLESGPGCFVFPLEASRIVKPSAHCWSWTMAVVQHAWTLSIIRICDRINMYNMSSTVGNTPLVSLLSSRSEHDMTLDDNPALS